MDGHIVTRPLETADEFRASHATQKAAWGFPDYMIIPYTQLITLRHNGGLVLGAFDGAGLAGLVIGYLARQGTGPLYLFSQRMGVLPAYRGRGIGEQLKWAQRAWALEQDLDRIVWTYDPLEAPNAWLNLAKLGGIVRDYRRDLFGHHGSSPQSLLPSDRLVVEWELLSDRVLGRLASGWSPPAAAELLARTAPLITVTWDGRGLPCCSPPDLGQTGSALLAEVPADWQGLLKADPALAGNWRTQTRRLFEHYLGQGYAVTGYASERLAGHRRNFYFLERE